jgi:hypothetical protein
MNPPRTKYSKRAIELQKAETELIRLSQYDDARKVRQMLQKLLPVEERDFFKRYEEMIRNKRKALRHTQDIENIKLEEKLKNLRWNGVRKREKLINIGEQRIKNHEHDMRHAHMAESKLKPEMSVKPSALWIKRAGYQRTAAALRGDQLLQRVNTGDSPDGKRPGRGATEAKFVFAASLTDKHDFDNHANLSGTYSLD